MLDALYLLMLGGLWFLTSLPILIAVIAVYGAIAGGLERKKHDADLASSRCYNCKAPYGKAAVKLAWEACLRTRSEIQKQNPGSRIRFSSELNMVCLNCSYVGSFDNEMPSLRSK